MEKGEAISLNIPFTTTVSSPCKIRHFDASNVEQIAWDDNEANKEAKKFLIPLIQNGTKKFIDNVEAEVNALSVDSQIIPLIITNDNYENSFVCSPYGLYISYALESINGLFKNKYLSKAVKKFVSVLGKGLKKSSINKILYVNNWLCPTDLYSKQLTAEQISAITDYLTRQFPHHAIAFKSINQAINESLYKSLKSKGYEFIVSRQIFLTDTSKEEIFKTRIFKSDLKLLKESNFNIIDKKDLSQEEQETALSLYKQLYIEKYSKLNPQLTKNYLDLDFLNFKAIKKDRGIEGVFGYFIRDGVMTAPFFGHKENTSDGKSLYRILSTLLTLEAKEKKCLLHQSAGASFYKKVRRAEPHMEYLAVFTKHLPFNRKFPWTLLKIIMNNSSHFFKKY